MGGARLLLHERLLFDISRGLDWSGICGSGHLLLLGIGVVSSWLLSHHGLLGHHGLLSWLSIHHGLTWLLHHHGLLAWLDVHHRLLLTVGLSGLCGSENLLFLLHLSNAATLNGLDNTHDSDDDTDAAGDGNEDIDEDDEGDGGAIVVTKVIVVVELLGLGNGLGGEGNRSIGLSVEGSFSLRLLIFVKRVG